jgi:amino acid permease
MSINTEEQGATGPPMPPSYGLTEDLAEKSKPTPDIHPSPTSGSDIQEGAIQEGIILENGLRRGLEGRHVSLISLASVIGASCFYGFGYALYLSGPVGALIGFGIVGFMVWALMQSVGEVTTMFPIAGGFIEVSTGRWRGLRLGRGD